MTYFPKLYTDEETLWWMSNIVLKECEVRVAWVDGIPAGLLAKQNSTIENLYGELAQQNHKIGSALLQEVLNSADFLDLWVFQENRKARAFYQKFGIELVEETDGERNEEKVPNARYEWRRV